MPITSLSNAAMTEDHAIYTSDSKNAHSGSTRILSDRVRCHDGQCIVRHQCARWMERDTGSDDWVIYAETLRERWQCNTTPCTAYTKPPLPEDEA